MDNTICRRCGRTRKEHDIPPYEYAELFRETLTCSGFEEERAGVEPDAGKGAHRVPSEPGPGPDHSPEKTIWKYPIAVLDVQVIKVPRGAEVLTAQKQGHVICLWFVVPPESPLTGREVRIFGTGHPMPEEFSFHPIGAPHLAPEGSFAYAGTVQDNHPHFGLVWHVFVGPEEK